eukprot:jgi/Botrbrau1/16961/Bobra.49_2s0024.1
MNRPGSMSLAEAFIAFFNEKAKGNGQGRFFSPKASDSSSAGLASPPGTPPRYEGPPASAFGRVCSKCGGDGKVSEWRDRSASEVECDMCKGSGHLDEPATPCTPSSACDAPLEGSSSFTRRSSKGLVLFTRTEDEELAVLKQDDLPQAVPAGETDEENWKMDSATDALHSRESISGSSAPASAPSPRAVASTSVSPPTSHRDVHVDSASGHHVSPPMHASDASTSRQTLAEGPQGASTPAVVAQASARLAPGTCAPAVLPKRTSDAPVLRRWSSPGGPGDVAVCASLVGRPAESASAVWEAIQRKRVPDGGQDCSGDDESVPCLERRLSLDVESIRTRISVYKKERDEFEKELAEVSEPQASHELMFEVLRQMRAQISHLESLVAQKVRIFHPSGPQPTPAPGPTAVAKALPPSHSTSSQRNRR